MTLNELYKQIAAAMKSYTQSMSAQIKPNANVANYIIKEALQLMSDDKGPDELKLLRLSTLI